MLKLLHSMHRAEQQWQAAQPKTAPQQCSYSWEPGTSKQMSGAPREALTYAEAVLDLRSILQRNHVPSNLRQQAIIGCKSEGPACSSAPRGKPGKPGAA